MTSNSNSQTQQNIQHRIDKVFDFTPTVKIQKLEYGMIKVNNMLIHSDYFGWHVKSESFFRRKSAVGYAICLVKKDHKKAKRIQDLDANLEKLKIDLDFYHYHMRKSKNPVKKLVMSNRISDVLPTLLNTDTQLTQLLKTVLV